MSHRSSWQLATGIAALGLLLAACAPAAPSPTAAPAKPAEAAKPAATAAPAKPTEAPAAKPAEAKPAPSTGSGQALSKAEGPAASPAAAAKPAEAKPAASPAAKPAEAKPAASPAAKPALSKAEGATFDEKAVADFYRGKNIRIIVGFTPGGNFDLYSRLLARFLPKYVPGSPNVIVENRPGAGSMVAANAVYKSEAKDGTVIASINQNLLNQQAMTLPGIEFDVTKYQWLGAAQGSIPGCAVRTDLGINSVQEVMTTREVATAADAPGTGSHDVPSVLNLVLGTKFKIVPGYTGSSRQRLAIEGKEAEAYCQADSLAAVFQPLLEGPNPASKKIIILGSERSNHPLLKDAVPAETLAKTDDDRRLLRVVYAPNIIGYPWGVAPEVPRDRVLALRSGVEQVFKDPDFLAETKKSNVVPDFHTGDEIARIAQEVLSTPQPVLDRLKKILQ
jgi:tripartite-type tricarboxylate transporter receptor subunit TctC